MNSSGINVASYSPPAVVLAGGLSRRMGGVDKSLIELAGKPMISHTLDRLSRQAGPLMINANGDAGRFEKLGIPVVEDVFEGHAGPLAGILTAMMWANENAPSASHVVTTAADTPFLPADLVSRLMDVTRKDASQIALASSNGRVHPVVGAWPVNLADDLKEYLIKGENRKVLVFVDKYSMEKTDFENLLIGDNAVDPFFNVNTPEDLAMAEKTILEKQR